MKSAKACPSPAPEKRQGGGGEGLEKGGGINRHESWREEAVVRTTTKRIRQQKELAGL